MTAGNRVQVPTPFMTSTNTGGPDPVAGCNDVAVGLIGASEGPSSSDPGLGNFGVADGQGNASMLNMDGPGSEELTFANTNADASGNTSMQDMSGASLGEPTRAMNTDAGRGLPNQGNDHNWNPMSSYQ